jgi:hypothetical protein
MKKYTLLFLLCFVKFSLFSQGSSPKIEIEYDTTSNSKIGGSDIVIKTNSKVVSDNKIALVFLYHFNSEKVIVFFNNKKVVNEKITSEASGYSKRVDIKSPSKADSISLEINIGDLKFSKVELRKTKYIYFFFEKENSLLKIKATNSPLPSE